MPKKKRWRNKPMSKKNEDEYTYYSVSDYAYMIGKSTTYVYSLIASGKLETIPYKRGKYNGYIIKEKTTQ